MNSGRAPDPKDWWLDYTFFFAKTVADRPTGLIATTRDLVERAFFSLGTDDCKRTVDLFDPAISEATFRDDQLASRAAFSADPSFSTFFPETNTHTFLIFDEFYTVRAGDMRLVDRFAAIVRGESPGHRGR